MSAYTASLDRAVKTQRILHQGTREKTEAEEENSTSGNKLLSSQMSGPGRDDALRTEKERLHDIST